MKYLLDTNVLCEVTRPQPNRKVLNWLVQNSATSVVSVISLGEIWKGIERMPEGKRKIEYQDWFNNQEEDLQSRILDVDMEIMKVWGSYCSKHQKQGISVSLLDSLLAATAKANGLVIVTRNESDFPDVSVFNPWN